MAFDRFDMLIRGGRVLDGTGNPYVKLDIGLSAGRIALLARDIDPERANQLLDAHGLAVCPALSTPTPTTICTSWSGPRPTPRFCRV